MKSPEEKIQFKNHFFKLGQGRLIPASDSAYWLVFWCLPRDLADIYDLLTPFDVQTVRDQNLPNFLLLVYVTSVEVVETTRNFTPRRHLHLLNCLRLLAKLVPYIYELPNYLDDIEPCLFWSRKFSPLDVLPLNPKLQLNGAEPTNSTLGDDVLAMLLIRALVQLLFTPEFTIDPAKTENTLKILLWEPGIGSALIYQPPNSIHDSNRVEVLRAIAALISVSFYEKPSSVISQGSRFLTLLVTSLPKPDLISLVCSLFNITCRSARKAEDSGLVYENSVLSELRYLCVSLSAQLLTSMLVYPIPSLDTTSFLLDHKLISTLKPLNMARIFFGKLSKESELMFMASHLLNILKFPFYSQETVRTKSAKIQPSPWALEASIILWELLQCNKSFRSSISERLLLKLAPYLLYHVFAFYDMPQHSNVVKISAYFLFYISTDNLWSEALIAPMSDAVIEAFPPEFRPPQFMSTRDFLILQICIILNAFITSGQGKLPPHLQTFLVPSLVESLYNFIPVVNENIVATNDAAKRMANINPMGGLSYLACNAVTQLLVTFSSKQFLLEAPRNAEMLALILRSLCCAATKNPDASRMLLFTFMKNEKTFDAIWSVIYSLGNEYFYGENMKLMNVQEDDENAETNEFSQFQAGLYHAPPVLSPDQHSISSVTTNEDHFSGFKDSVNNSLNNSMVCILPEESEDDEEKALDAALRPAPPTGMSLKAREKLPQESTLSQTWGGNDALRIIITILIPHMKLKLEDLWRKDGKALENFAVVRQIEKLNWTDIIELNKVQINYDFLPSTAVHKLPFKWSHLSLGWYMSTLYWDIYSGADTIRNFVKTSTTLMNNISLSIAVLSKFASSWSGLGGSSAPADPEDQIAIDYVTRGLTMVNLWELTSVKLFKNKPNDSDKIFNAFGLKFGSAHQGSGVNDITNSLARRFSDFRMNSRSSISTVSSMPPDEAELPRLCKRNSVSSLHSLNTLNRTRSNTPRNSFSI